MTGVDPLESQSPFERLGGEQKVRAIVDSFMERVFADRMIGFFFRSVDRERIKEMEYQLAAEFLGAGIAYQGRPLHIVHAKHPIMGGHFARRRQILQETLDEYGVAAPIRDAWLRHTDSLREQITPEAATECDPVAARQRVKRP